MSGSLNTEPRSNRMEESGEEDGSAQVREERHLIRKGKLILYNRPPDPQLNERIVSVKYYNSFGTNLFPSRSGDLPLSAGITSAGVGEGKTLVAANLAVYFALDTQDDTVIVDLNFSSPKLHEVFGIDRTPGILDSLHNDTITISRTSIKGLWLLPLGNAKDHAPSGFDQLIMLREVLQQLRQKFRFVLVDLPPASDPTFPSLVVGSLEGCFVVVSVGRTKMAEVKAMVRVVNENKIIGFVMNKIPGKKAS